MSLKQLLKEIEETKGLQAKLLEKQKNEEKAKALEGFKLVVEAGLEGQLKDSLRKTSPSFALSFSHGTVGEEKMKEVVLNKLKSYLDSEDIKYVVTSSKVTYVYSHFSGANGYYTINVVGSLKL